jgi:hypothetical protein
MSSFAGNAPTLVISPAYGVKPAVQSVSARCNALRALLHLRAWPDVTDPGAVES